MSPPRAEPPSRRELYGPGVRAALPFALTILILGVSFGVFAGAEGVGPVASVVMSATAFAASAQFGAVSVLGAGGGALAAIVAGLLLNARFGPMGVAVAPYLRGGRARRFAEAQAVVDTSWALASQGGGRFDRELLIGATLPQYPLWVGGTLLGVLAGAVVADPEALGLDAVFATFFLSLLARELRDPRGRWVAALAGVVAVGLLPVAPPGLPILAACAVALIGLRPR